MGPVAPAQAAPEAAAPAAVVVAPQVVFTTASVRDPHTKKGAVAAAKRWFRYWNNEDWEGQYNRVVTQQRDQFTLDDFTQWRSGQDSFHVTWLKTVRRTAFKHDHVPGTDVSLGGVKVTARVKIYGQKTTVAMHWYYQGGRWRWALTQSGLDEILASQR